MKRKMIRKVQREGKRKRRVLKRRVKMREVMIKINVVLVHPNIK